MAKVLYSASMSPDGFIAGAGGDASWMTEYLGPDPAIDELISQTGVLLVGNRTFGGETASGWNPSARLRRAV